MPRDLIGAGLVVGLAVAGVVILHVERSRRRRLEARIAELTAANQTLAGEVERNRIDEQLVQTRKMEAIGNLTGGLAHDFNNRLGVIIGNLDLLRGLLAARDEAVALADEALEAALRGAELNRRLLAFARRQPLAPQRVALNDLITNIFQSPDSMLGEQVHLALALAGAVWPVIVDPMQLEAAITNLATNARDAMPHGGTLTIVTVNRHLDEDYVTLHPDVAPGDYVAIENG